MPDVETIMEPWTDGDQQDKEMPDFENADLLTLIDDVSGTWFNYYSQMYDKTRYYIMGVLLLLLYTCVRVNYQCTHYNYC